MYQRLKKLLRQKENLKERIMICEIGNDAYYSSPLYKEHQQMLCRLNKEIENLQDDENFLLKNRFSGL